MITTGIVSDSAYMKPFKTMPPADKEQFLSILDEANQQLANQQNAKDILKNMSSDDLALVKKVNGLSGDINIDALSQERAINLLQHPDRKNMVDIDNNGYVEVGNFKWMMFPSPNAPAHVHAAWEKTMAQMPDADPL